MLQGTTFKKIEEGLKTLECPSCGEPVRLDLRDGKLAVTCSNEELRLGLLLVSSDRYDSLNRQRRVSLNS
jgi:hypothetical protein